METFYRVAADTTVTLHLAYVAFVVFGLVAVLVGYFRRWGWVRNRWFRGGHLAMIVIVVGEAWAGITCPLTVWEQQLRDLAGQETYRGAFLANLVHDLIFYDAPPWMFTVIYTAFGMLVAGSFLLAPPRWPWRKVETMPGGVDAVTK